MFLSSARSSFSCSVAQIQSNASQGTVSLDPRTGRGNKVCLTQALARTAPSFILPVYLLSMLCAPSRTRSLSPPFLRHAAVAIGHNSILYQCSLTAARYRYREVHQERELNLASAEMDDLYSQYAKHGMSTCFHTAMSFTQTTTNITKCKHKYTHKYTHTRVRAHTHARTHATCTHMYRHLPRERTL